MEPETLKIKCPMCGAVLMVRKMPNMESKIVPCPVCKQKNKFTAFKPYTPKGEEEHTNYGYGSQEDPTTYTNPNTDDTEIGKTPNYTLGQLQVVGSAQTFQLKIGKNLIGRKASQSHADFQIPLSPEKRRMSREHIAIEVQKVKGMGYIHTISLAKKEVNTTYVNDVRLEYGDKIVLKNKDLIKLPDASLLFSIPDDDETQI